MLLKDFKVSRPKSTKIQRKGNYSYVYQVIGQTYKSDRKYTVDKRVCIGRMIDENDMIPNEKFEQFYPELLISEKAAPAFSDTLRIGMFTLIQKIADDLRITELLDAIFEESRFILDLVSYIITNESCTFQYYSPFMRNHPFLSQIRTDSYISRFLKEDMEAEQIKAFISAWNIYHSENECVYIGYDSTNMNTAAKGIELADYGHPKVDEGLPQVNISYAVKQDDTTPLFYELYDGSIVDYAQCSCMVELAHDFGYKNIGFLLDRGYFSKKNIDYFRRHEYEYIMMMKDNNQCVQKAFNEVRIRLKNMEGYYIAEHEVCGATVKGKLFKDDEKEVYFHVYYDDIRAGEERKAYLNLLSTYEKELNKKVAKKIVMEGELMKYKKVFKLKYDMNGYLLGYQRNTEYIEKELNKKGYFTIVTSEKKDCAEVLDIYRGRDNIEKMFRTLKSGIDLNKYRVYSDASLQSKVFITFIALIIRNEIFQKLEKLRKTNKKYYTVPAIIYELENIEITKNNEGRYTRRYALTAKQKQILKQFEIDEKYLERKISHINLRMGQSK